MAESLQEAVPVKKTPKAAPREIETPSSKGIIHSIIPAFIHFINVNGVNGGRELGNNEQRQLRLDSFLQNFIPHPPFKRSTHVTRNITLVQFMSNVS